MMKCKPIGSYKCAKCRSSIEVPVYFVGRDCVCKECFLGSFERQKRSDSSEETS